MASLITDLLYLGQNCSSIGQGYGNHYKLLTLNGNLKQKNKSILIDVDLFHTF